MANLNFRVQKFRGMKNKLFSSYITLNIYLSFLFHTFAEHVNVGNLSVLNASFSGFCSKENLIVNYNEKQWSASFIIRTVIQSDCFSWKIVVVIKTNI